MDTPAPGVLSLVLKLRGGRQGERVSLLGDCLEPSKMEGDFETERDWAYLCQAFTVAKDAPLEAEKEYTVEFLEEGSRDDFASIDYVRMGVIVDEVEQGGAMSQVGAGVSEDEDRVRAVLGIPLMVRWLAG